METADMEKAAEVGVTANDGALLDDDGKPKRTGTVWTASAHNNGSDWCWGVVFALGYGSIGMDHWDILSVAHSFCHALHFQSLADCYRSPDPVTGKRNCTYMEAVKTELGGKMHVICALVQYLNLSGAVIGYTITTSISVV
ncbi:Amino acid transporter, transmembrane domain [Sesbania bispinosa]|nr:Amino acid transporter, transmembrane domain [Sesbania bispinosa]